MIERIKRWWREFWLPPRIEQAPMRPESMYAPISPESAKVLKGFTYFDATKASKKKAKKRVKRKKKTVTAR